MANCGAVRGISSRTDSSGWTGQHSRDNPDPGGPGGMFQGRGGGVLGRAARPVRCRTGPYRAPAATGAGGRSRAPGGAGRGRPGAAPAPQKPPCQHGPEPGKGVRRGGSPPQRSPGAACSRGGAARRGQGRRGGRGGMCGFFPPPVPGMKRVAGSGSVSSAPGASSLLLALRPAVGFGGSSGDRLCPHSVVLGGSKSGASPYC